MTAAYQEILATLKSLAVKHLSLSSQQLNSETAFVALPGSKHHGLEFIDHAIKADAPCVLIDAQTVYTSDDIPIIRVPHLIESLGNFAAAFYDYPSSKLAIHAVTGTNGKTSCSQFIAQALHAQGKRCAVIGTLGMGVWPDLSPIPNTTPDALTIQKFLAECVQQGIEEVSLEASSIALDIGRLQGCAISSALFTNLTQDHLDYHHAMENYADAKKKLFSFPGLKTAIIFVDDSFGKQLLECCAPPIVRWATTLTSPTEYLSAEHTVSVLSATYTQQGIQAEIQTPQGVTTLNSALLGQFNLENLLLIVAWLLARGLTLAETITCTTTLRSPKGRMDALIHKGKPCVVIDYACTPDALEKALQVLRHHCQGKLYCVFGCGGNRDALKRPLMGAIATQYADYVIITTDNARDEEPADIAAQILPQPIPGKSEIILNREQAIAHAIQQATAEDLILIAGKGHETYQEIKGHKFPCDDFLLAEKYLN